ncbi:MAG TPA: transposase, partial [Ramlibacter sp.]
MQSNSMIHGVDVAKDELVVQCLGGRSTLLVGNNAAEIRRWLGKLPKGSTVAMESTGKYHQLLARLAYAAGMQVYVLNAQRLYFYAKALDVRAKTDRVDAGVIARYVAEHSHKLHLWRPPAAHQGRIDELVRRRALVVVKRESFRQSLGDCKELKAEFNKVDQALKALVQFIDRKIDELVKVDEKLRNARTLIDGVVGFGPVG